MHPRIVWKCTFFLLLVACSPRLPASDYHRVPSYALTDTSYTPLAKAYEVRTIHTGESGFHLLPLGPEALMMRIALVEATQKSIDLQYFSTRDDTTGKLLLEAVTRAAMRGVRVRILLDDWNLDDFEAGAVGLNANPNIAIRVFNPYSTRDQSFFSRIGNVFSYAGKFNHHMHNKALIADNQVAIMGGRNLGDEYFDAGKDLNLQDVDVFAVGPITQHISQNFDRYWNSDESFPIEMLNLPAADTKTVDRLHKDMQQHWNKLLSSSTGKQLLKIPLPKEVKNGTVPLIWAKAELVADNPKKVELPGTDTHSAPAFRLDQLVAGAKDEFL